MMKQVKEKMGMLRVAAVVIALIGIAVIAVGIWKEKEKEQAWAANNAKITSRIQPFEAEKRELEKQDDAWLQRLEDTKKGTACVLLSFENMDTNLSQSIFPIMSEYGYRGTFALQNGAVPGTQPEWMSMEEFHGMLGAGWEYAFLTESPEGDEDGTKWQEQLDAQIAAWNGAGIGTPAGYFFTSGQSSKEKEAVLKERGFSVWRDPQQNPEYIDAMKDGTLTVKSVTLTKDSSTLETALANAVEKKESVAFNIPSVLETVEGDTKAVTTAKFRQFLSEIKEQEAAGNLQVMTYFQYFQYKAQLQAEAEALKPEYDAFCQQKDARIKELDAEIRKVLEEYR